MQWLITLEPILWDFKELTMQFTWKEHVDGQVLLMSKRQASKVHGTTSKGAYTMLLTGCAQGTLNTIQVLEDQKGILPFDLHQLLELFIVPTELPPHIS